MDQQNTLDEQTTIVGRPTYVVMFAGAQDAGPILEKLTSIGYPREDISILLRPAGTDSAIDLLSGENAAGQDTDAAAKERHSDKEPTTLVLLHPEPNQVEAVRQALTGMGGKEFEYEPETRFTGEDSEAEVAKATGTNVESVNAANRKNAGATVDTTATNTQDPDKATRDTRGEADTAAPAPLANHSSTAGVPTATTGTASSSAATVEAEAPAKPAPQAALPYTGDLKSEIQQLAQQVDHVKDELKQRE